MRPDVAYARDVVFTSFSILSIIVIALLLLKVKTMIIISMVTGMVVGPAIVVVSIHVADMLQAKRRGF